MTDFLLLIVINSKLTLKSRRFWPAVSDISPGSFNCSRFFKQSRRVRCDSSAVSLVSLNTHGRAMRPSTGTYSCFVAVTYRLPRSVTMYTIARPRSCCATVRWPRSIDVTTRSATTTIGPGRALVARAIVDRAAGMAAVAAVVAVAGVGSFARPCPC